MKIGYARSSTQDQNIEYQVELLEKEGCQRIFKEHISGSSLERPELNRMLDTLREGDEVVFTELTRLSRSVKDLFILVEKIQEVKANVKSLKEPWLDTTTPQGRLVFSFFAGISQFERELIRQRTMEGLASARARGRKGGRPKTDTLAIEQAIALYESKKFTVKQITEQTGVSRTTLYEYLRK